MRKEKEINTRGSNLTKEQRKIRDVIKWRQKNHRVRMARAEKDEGCCRRREKKNRKGVEGELCCRILQWKREELEFESRKGGTMTAPRMQKSKEARSSKESQG